MTARTALRRAGFDLVFGHALAGEVCHVVAGGRDPVRLPVEDWQRPADHADRAMLATCVGATIDLGCGPGRLTIALAEQGRTVLGVDVAGAAVTAAIARGGHALQRDLFGRLPGEGRWQTALLADGNIGIGGDPVPLLRRVRRLLVAGGRVVVEVAAPHVESARLSAHLECGCARTRPFDWSVLGQADVAATAAAAGLSLRSHHQEGDRWWSVLEVA